uniref:F-box only protein 27-like n=1 Tax=Camelus bactrianus TaxID=9837 RepID=A0A9W3EEP3_CAMBA|nr:F-box only protein 27-like [Camelus bactrianus]
MGATGAGEENTDASAFTGHPVGVPAPEPEPEEVMGLSQLPPELLLVVLWPGTTAPCGRSSAAACRALTPYCYRKKVLDLEEEGLWPELLDSGKVEISVYDWRIGRQWGNSCTYDLSIQLLDANQAILDQFSTMLFPIWNGRHTSFFELLRARPWHNGTYLFLCLQVSHVFSNLKTGVRFVSFEHWACNLEVWPDECGISVFSSTVIVRFCG